MLNERVWSLVLQEDTSNPPPAAVGDSSHHPWHAHQGWIRELRPQRSRAALQGFSECCPSSHKTEQQGNDGFLGLHHNHSSFVEHQEEVPIISPAFLKKLFCHPKDKPLLFHTFGVVLHSPFSERRNTSQSAQTAFYHLFYGCLTRHQIPEETPCLMLNEPVRFIALTSTDRRLDQALSWSRMKVN